VPWAYVLTAGLSTLNDVAWNAQQRSPTISTSDLNRSVTGGDPAVPAPQNLAKLSVGFIAAGVGSSAPLTTASSRYGRADIWRHGGPHIR